MGVQLLLPTLLLLLLSSLPSSASSPPPPPSSRYYSRALVDLVGVLTQVRVGSMPPGGPSVVGNLTACMDDEIPPGAPLWTDDAGGMGAEGPAAFLSRTLTETHPEAASFVACLLERGLVSSDVLRRHGAPLLFTAATLAGITPGDPVALLRGFLDLGAPLTHTLGAGALLTKGKTLAEGIAAGLPVGPADPDGYNLLHRVLSRDKLMLGDVANRLLQPDDGLGGHYGLYLAAVAESIAKHLAGAPKAVEEEEAARVRHAVRTLLSKADVHAAAAEGGEGQDLGGDEEGGEDAGLPDGTETEAETASMKTKEGGGDAKGRRARKAKKAAGKGKSATGGPAPLSDAVLGRRVPYLPLQTLSNGLAQVSLLAILVHLRGASSGAAAASAASAASSSPLPGLASQTDRYERNPLHVGVLTDNAGALGMLVDELLVRTTTDSEGASALRAALSRRDVFGYTPRALAAALGHVRSLDVLAAAEAALGVEDTTAAAAPARPYRRGLGRRLVFNTTMGLLDETWTGAATETESGTETAIPAPALSLYPASTGGWESPAHTAPRREAAVAAGIAAVAATPNACDLDVVDFSCPEEETALGSGEFEFEGGQNGTEEPGAAPRPRHCSAAVAANATLPASLFLSSFVVPSRPVLLRGLARHWPVREAWALNSLLDRHGRAPMAIADIPYAPIFGKGARSIALAGHVRAMMHCTPGMGGGEDLLPEGLTPELCALYSGRAAEEEQREREKEAERARASAGRVRKGSNKIGGGEEEEEENGGEGDADSRPPPAASGGGAAAAAASLSSPYVFNRIGATEPLAAALVGDMTLLPWFLDAVLPRKGGQAKANKTEAEVAANGAATTQKRAASAGPHDETLVLPRPTPPSPQFYVGGPGTGAPLHYHEDAWNTLAHGRKAWFLLPPSAAEYTTVPIADYVIDVLPRLKDRQRQGTAGKAGEGGGGAFAWAPGSRPLVCAQEAGDVIYVPAGWGHAVLNLAPSVGFAVEFFTPFQRY
jgi:hypothetical protein